MQFTSLLTPANMSQGVFVSSKKRALELVSELLSQGATESDQELCARACFQQLIQREKLGSTCINHGIALPHAKLPAQCDIQRPIVAFLQLATPIDYGAADHKPVDLIFALLVPEEASGWCCKTLQHFAAQLVENKALLKQLRSAESVDALWQAFHEADQAALRESAPDAETQE